MKKQGFWQAGILVCALSSAGLAWGAPEGPMPEHSGPEMMGHGHPWMHHGPRHGPMGMGGPQDGPVPMLLPMVWHNAVKLKLTPEQDGRLEQWRKTQMQSWHAERQNVMAHNRALRQALMQGQSGSALKPLEDAVLADHQAMLEKGVAQVRFVHQLLSPVQWQELSKMVQNADKHRWPHRGPWQAK